jgi:hypothetical protein
MTTQTTKVNLTIDGVDVKVGHELLEDIVRYMPDTKENTKVFEKLALNSSCMVREQIARKENINKKTIKILLADKRHGIIGFLVKNQKVANKLTPKQIKNIIALGNPIHCMAIASSLNDLTKCDICKVAKFLSNHNDPIVRFELVNRWNKEIPKNIIKKLTKDIDIDVANAAKERLKK